MTSFYLKRLTRYLELIKPTKHKTIHAMLLIKIFVRASLISPSLNKLILSMLYVEKVVKAPSIPMKRNVLRLGETVVLSNAPHKKPIANDPSRFTVRVPQGKTLSKYRCGKPEIAYLKRALIAPPSAIYKNFIRFFAISLY